MFNCFENMFYGMMWLLELAIKVEIHQILIERRFLSFFDFTLNYIRQNLTDDGYDGFTLN